MASDLESDNDRGPANVRVCTKCMKIRAQDQDSYIELEVASSVKIRTQTFFQQIPHVNLNSFSYLLTSHPGLPAPWYNNIGQPTNCVALEILCHPSRLSVTHFGVALVVLLVCKY